MDPFVVIFLSIVLTVAAVTDVRKQRIPNLITFPAMVVGVGYHGLTQGMDGLLFGLGGLALGLGVMIVPHLMGLMGAGDVKLMAVVGVALGPTGVLVAFVFTSLFGGLYALIMLVPHWSTVRRIMSAFWAAVMAYMATRKFQYEAPDPDSRLPRLCYGLAIAFGAAAAMGLNYLAPKGVFGL